MPMPIKKSTRCHTDLVTDHFKMGRRARAKQSSVVPQLPREVVQLIFSMRVRNKHDDCSELVLSPRDRVRALAVCQAWKAYLDPTMWPIDNLYLDGSQKADLRIAAWVASSRPALRTLHFEKFQAPEQLVTLSSLTDRTALVELSLYGEERVVHDSLVAVQLFPRLRVLTLVLPDTDIGGRLNLRALQPLPALERLACGAWERVDLRGSTRLRQLTSLEIWDAGSVDIDATLPSLQELVVMGADTLGLTGKRLQLPQLTHLNLTFIDMVAVNWRALPQLAELLVASCEELNTVALPELGCLTSLSLDYGQHSESWQVADGILQAAPSSLLSLSITGLEEEEWLQPPMLSSMPQLTSLSSRSPAIIAQLGPLSRLQHLEFPWHSATDLSLEHLDCLCGLTSLRQLEFGITVRNRDAERRLEVLRRVLPPGCILDQPMRS